MRVCIVGASGKLGQYMVQHALDRGYEVVGVCRGSKVKTIVKVFGPLAHAAGGMNSSVGECAGPCLETASDHRLIEGSEVASPACP